MINKPHAVCMPWPAQGHIHAMLKLAKLLHFKGFHITFVHTEFNYNRILSTDDASLTNSEHFRYETIPDSLSPPSSLDATQDIDSLCIAIQHKFAAPFGDLIKKLNEPSSAVPQVTCIVSDSFTSFTLEIAQSFKIPDVFFCSVSACGYMAMIYYKELEDKGLMPLQAEEELNNCYLNTLIDWIPGLKNTRLKDIPNFSTVIDPDRIKYNFIKHEAQQAHRASAIIINTFDDLEARVLDAMSSFLPPIYTTGPLTLLCRQLFKSNMRSIGSNSLWKEDRGCLSWLEGREACSVLYVNFGSLALITNEQLIEFAWGLANSEHYFLWIIRPDVVEGESAVLPKEFLEVTRDRGMLCSWCPQEEILMHSSIGGFLTHCGWNSVMESISAGVPMLCWPYFADQITNCRYLCTEWGIGLEIDKSVKSQEVKEMIRELMGKEKGKAMRNEAKKWKDKAHSVSVKSEKSFTNLERVIKEVLLKEA